MLQICRVWNKGDGRVKLICMAPKAGAKDTPVNTGPTLGVNTGDRNGTQTDGEPPAPSRVRLNEPQGNGSSNKTDVTSKTGKDDQYSHNVSSNGNDSGVTKPASHDSGMTKPASHDSAAPQLKTEIGSLQLAAPGTARHDQSNKSSDAVQSENDYEGR